MDIENTHLGDLFLYAYIHTLECEQINISDSVIVCFTIGLLFAWLMSYNADKFKYTIWIHNGMYVPWNWHLDQVQ